MFYESIIALSSRRCATPLLIGGTSVFLSLAMRKEKSLKARAKEALSLTNLHLSIFVHIISLFSVVEKLYPRS